MTLYFLSGFSAVVGEDFLVINKGNEYHFCGITLKGQSYEPNSIPFGRGYTIRPNACVVLFPEKTSYLVDGREEAVVYHEWKNAGAPDSLLFTTVLVGPYVAEVKQSLREKSHWPQIIERLKNRPPTDGNSKLIRTEMEKWELVSEHTLQWLIQRMSEADLSRGETEIMVSGTYWLVHYRQKNRLIVGSMENVWGEARLSSELEEIRLAAPVPGGWVIKTTEGDWLVLYNYGALELRQVICPVGIYEKFGSWIYWGAEEVICTPTRRMVVLPELTGVNNATRHWAIAHQQLKNKIVMINQEGEIYTEEIPTQYGQMEELLVGNNGLFAVHRRGKYYRFSLIPESNLPSLHHSWQQIAFPNQLDFSCETGVIRGDPDIFVALILHTHKKPTLNICLINTNGEVFVSPIPIEVPFYFPRAVFESQGEGQVLIVLQDRPNETMKIRIQVLDNFVQLDAGLGAIITGKMDRLPTNRQKALWESLKPLIEPEATPE